MKNVFIILTVLISIGSFAQKIVQKTTSDKPIAGFKLTKIEPGSVYQQLGLKDGDVVKKINGEAPISLDAFGASLSKAKSGEKVKVLIERQGKEEAFEYTIK